MEMVESTFGDEMAKMVEKKLESNGRYTLPLGLTIIQELVAMAITLSKETGLPVDALVEAFGKH